MRKAVWVSFLSVVVGSAAFACVGDDPVDTGPLPNDAGSVDQSVPVDGSLPAVDSGVDAVAPDGAQEAGPAPCSKIVVSTLSGTGAAGLIEGAGNVARFEDSQGVTVGPDGTLYVADNNNKRIRKVLTDGTTSTFAANATTILSAYRLSYRAGEIWLIDRTNDALVRVLGGTPPSASISYQFGALQAVGTSPTAIYVTTTQEAGVRKMNASVNNSTIFTGNAQPGTADGNAATARFSMDLADLAFDGGFMFVADRGNSRIRKVSEADGTTTTFAGSTPGFADGAGTAAKFESPSGLAFDPTSRVLYVADKTRIRAISPTGTVTTVAGSTAGFDDGDACTAKFGELRGIAYFAGSLFAVDVNKVRKIKLP